MNETDHLIESYIDNDLQDDQARSLSEWLRADRAHVNRFVRDCFLHWQLFAIGQRTFLQTEVEAMPRQARLHEMRRVLSGRPSEHPGPATPAFRRFRRPVIAAVLLVSCSFAAWWFSRAWQPQTVAQLTKASADATWKHHRGRPVAGNFFQEGELVELTNGRILATLSTGVQIVIQAPATVRMGTGHSVFLQSGRITVTVPRQTSGFVVGSPIARFLDLGTEFTLAIENDSTCEIHVFSGLIEMQPTEVRRFDRLRVPEGRAIAYDADTGNVDRLPYRAEEKLTL